MRREGLWAISLWLLSSLLAQAAGLPEEKSLPPVLQYKHPGLPGRVTLRQTEAGALLYEFRTDTGPVTLSPQDFADYLLQTQVRPPWTFRLLNISSWGGVVWIGIGLAGQILFAARMLVQWICSEKARRSVVPVAFWWISLGGASLLLAYFLWRRDFVGVLGQATGWAIYLRNLVLIHRKAA